MKRNMDNDIIPDKMEDQNFYSNESAIKKLEVEIEECEIEK